MRKPRVLWIAAAAAIVAAVFVARPFWGENGGSGSSTAPAARAQPAAVPNAVPVEAARVTVDRVVTQVNAVGTLQSNESVVIAPEIAGRVIAIEFKEGERVTAGTPLVRLDRTILEAQLAQAQADLTLAQTNYERASQLARQGTGTQRARDEAFAALQSTTAAVELAKAQLEKTVIVAPFDGVMGFREISPGKYVAPGERIANLENIDPLKLDFRVSEVFLSRLEVGQTVEITVDALANRLFTGEIYAISPLVDVNGRALQLRARIANPERTLKPGLFARVAVTVGQRPEAVLVPEAAIVPQGEKKLVFRVVEGKVRLSEVELGIRQAGMVEVVRGLDAGDVVVTSGQMRLRDGAAVEIVGPLPTGTPPQTAARDKGA